LVSQAGCVPAGTCSDGLAGARLPLEPFWSPFTARLPLKQARKARQPARHVRKHSNLICPGPCSARHKAQQERGQGLARPWYNYCNVPDHAADSFLTKFVSPRRSFLTVAQSLSLNQTTPATSNRPWLSFESPCSHQSNQRYFRLDRGLGSLQPLIGALLATQHSSDEAYLASTALFLLSLLDLICAACDTCESPFVRVELT